MNKIIRNVKTKERFIEISKTIPNPTKLQFNTNTKELEIGNKNGVVIYKFKEEDKICEKFDSLIEISKYILKVEKEIFND